jgi:hypothetical protein
VDYARLIAPQSTGVIHGTIDTRSLRGEVHKSILVISNDPDQPSLRLSARALVTPAIEIVPGPLVRLDTVRGHGASTAVILAASSPAGAAFEITSVSTGASYVDASFRRLGSDELLPARGPSQYEITIQLKEDAPLGVLSTPVIIRTDLVPTETVTLKVTGVVSSSIDVAPARRNTVG